MYTVVVYTVCTCTCVPLHDRGMYCRDEGVTGLVYDRVCTVHACSFNEMLFLVQVLSS